MVDSSSKIAQKYSATFGKLRKSSEIFRKSSGNCQNLLNIVVYIIKNINSISRSFAALIREISCFIPYHRKYSQSEFKKTIVYSTVVGYVHGAYKLVFSFTYVLNTAL